MKYVSFTPPFRVGKKKKVAVLDSKGLEVHIFKEGMEEEAKSFCDLLNKNSQKNEYKISFDLHGVISDIPDVLKFITTSLINSGAEIHIITGSTTEVAKKELELLGYVEGKNYTHLQGVPDYLISKGHTPIGIHPVFLNPEFPPEIWDKSKGDYCKEKGINLHFDDSLVYLDNFTTPFARLFTRDR